MPSQTASQSETRAQQVARLAHRGVRIQAGDGGYYVIVKTGADRTKAETVANAVCERFKLEAESAL